MGPDVSRAALQGELFWVHPLDRSGGSAPGGEGFGERALIVQARLEAGLGSKRLVAEGQEERLGVGGLQPARAHRPHVLRVQLLYDHLADTQHVPEVHACFKPSTCHCVLGQLGISKACKPGIALLCHALHDKYIHEQF